MDERWKKLCALRIYMQRGYFPDVGLFKRVFRGSPGLTLVQAALKAGIPHASISGGQIGYTRGAKYVSSPSADADVDTLPVCVELVGERPLLESFVSERAAELAGATLILVEGVELARPVLVRQTP